MNNVKENYIIRLCDDKLFKEVFSKVPTALVRMVCDCLELDYEEIKDIAHVEKSSELSKNNYKHKSTTCDFVINVGEYFRINIEVNTKKYTGLDERNLLFLSRIYSNFIPKGIKYEELPKYKVAQLNINNFSNPNGDIISKIVMMDEKNKIIANDAMFYYNFDIAKCKNLYYNLIKKKSDKINKIIRWGALLSSDSLSDIDEIIGDDLMSKEEKNNINIVRSIYLEDGGSVTREKLEEHHRLKIEGEAFADGIEQGIEQEKIETVKKMLEKNYSIQEIIDITGLTEEEITKIKESN